MIKAVIFDFGGVLTEGGKAGSITQNIARMYGISPEEATKMDDGTLAAQMLRGEMSHQAYFAALDVRQSGPVHGTKELFEQQADIFVKSEPVYAFAAQLRSHGIKTGILSNMFEIGVDRLEREGFYDDFNPLILSCREHCAKPDAKIYQLAIERSGVPPDEIVFIDDQERQLVPARQLGMHTILAESPQQIVADTKELIHKLNGLALQ